MKPGDRCYRVRCRLLWMAWDSIAFVAENDEQAIARVRAHVTNPEVGWTLEEYLIADRELGTTEEEAKRPPRRFGARHVCTVAARDLGD